ncbi:MAG: EAL domain-containing protein [Pseudomonadota bacterium]
MGAQAVRLSNVDINNALKNREFEVLFQPIFDLGNGALARVETFVRWRHPSLGALPPGAFVSFFENQGRMSELTRYVIAEALDKYVDWRGASGPGLSINLAMSDLSDETFAPHFEKLLRDAAFPIDLVTLECPMPPVDMPLETSLDHFRRLSGLGARLAIEVRGRANEFLRALDPFPFDEIKTGGASILRFARTVRGPGLSAISDLLDIASKANAAITAVGVEDQASLSALKGLGFTAAQGNHLANVGELSEFRTAKVNEVRELLGIEPLSQENLSALFRTDGLNAPATDDEKSSTQQSVAEPRSSETRNPETTEAASSAPVEEPTPPPVVTSPAPSSKPMAETRSSPPKDETLAGASTTETPTNKEKSSMPSKRASTIDAAKRARARERAKAYALAKRAKARRMRKEAAIERVKSRAGLTTPEGEAAPASLPIDVEATDLPPVQSNPAPLAMQDRLTKEFGPAVDATVADGPKERTASENASTASEAPSLDVAVESTLENEGQPTEAAPTKIEAPTRPHSAKDENTPVERFNAPHLALTGVPAYFVPGIRVKGAAEDVIMDASVVERLAAEARLMDPSLDETTAALEAQTREDPTGSPASEAETPSEALDLVEPPEAPKQPNLLDDEGGEIARHSGASMEQGDLHSEPSLSAQARKSARLRKNFFVRKHRIALPDHFWPKPWKRKYLAWREERSTENASETVE